jgi:hypothetical protein
VLITEAELACSLLWIGVAVAEILLPCMRVEKGVGRKFK